jgi:hypothetical protein
LVTVNSFDTHSAREPTILSSKLDLFSIAECLRNLSWTGAATASGSHLRGVQPNLTAGHNYFAVRFDH